MGDNVIRMELGDFKEYLEKEVKESEDLEDLALMLSNCSKIILKGLYK